MLQLLPFLKGAISVPFQVFGGARIPPLGHHFRRKNRLCAPAPSSGNRPEADPAPHEPPKAPRNAFSSILDRLEVDSGWILVRCWMTFVICSHVFKPQPHKPTNIKPRPGGMRARALNSKNPKFNPISKITQKSH